MTGLFLGHEVVHDYSGQAKRGERVELPIGALSTHTFVCGATGAGKTVFAKAIVEEAALAGIPVIVIDLKGDLASLALTADVLAHPDIGKVLGNSGPDTLQEYHDGVAGMPAIQANQQAFSSQVEVRLFSPRASLARRLALTGLPTFSGPSSEIERDDRRTLVESLARSLVSSSGTLNAKQTQQAKLVEEIVWHLVESGVPLQGKQGIEALAEALGSPPFEKLGGLPLEEFISPASRADIRATVASRIVGASAGLFEGEPLKVETLIGGGDGRTPIAVIYLGHLAGFAEQAGVIAQVCSEVYRWMRKVGGSDKPRALVYIDEVGGGDGSTAFYPSFPMNPPSKAPLALLVKQGRSSGVGVLLATQNPVSVDVRGLGNIGTWAVGALRQRNDQEKVAHLFDGSSARRAKLRDSLAGAKRGEFLLQYPGRSDPLWVRERWLYTMHRQLSPDQLHALHQLKSGLPVPEFRNAPARPPSPNRSASKVSSPVHGFQSARASDDGGATRVLPPTATVEVDGAAPDSGPMWTLTWDHGSKSAHPGSRLLIGRAPNAHILLRGDTVSREHAELIVDASGVLTIVHRSSKNATKVDGVSVPDRLTLGPEQSRVTILLGEVAVLVVRDAKGPITE